MTNTDTNTQIAYEGNWIPLVSCHVAILPLLSYFMVLPNEWKCVLVDQHDKKRDYTLSSHPFFFLEFENLSMQLKKSKEYEVVHSNLLVPPCFYSDGD